MLLNTFVLPQVVFFNFDNVIEYLGFQSAPFFIWAERQRVCVWLCHRVLRKVKLEITVLVSCQTLWLYPLVKACNEGVGRRDLTLISTSTSPGSFLVPQSYKTIVPLYGRWWSAYRHVPQNWVHMVKLSLVGRGRSSWHLRSSRKEGIVFVTHLLQVVWMNLNDWLLRLVFKAVVFITEGLVKNLGWISHVVVWVATLNLWKHRKCLLELNVDQLTLRNKFVGFILDLSGLISVHLGHRKTWWQDLLLLRFGVLSIFFRNESIIGDRTLLAQC